MLKHCSEPLSYKSRGALLSDAGTAPQAPSPRCWEHSSPASRSIVARNKSSRSYGQSRDLKKKQKPNKL